MESEQFLTIKKPIINLTQFGQKKIGNGLDRQFEEKFENPQWRKIK